MTVIEYRCKFCKSPRAFECEEWPADVPINVEKFKGMLACDRCSDFQRKHNDITEWAVIQAVSLIRLRKAVRDEKKRVDAEGRIASRLTTITKAFAYHVCRFYATPVIWEQDFVDQIMRTPNLTIHALELYHRNIRMGVSQQEFVTQ